jgi:hypothetical protein
MRAYNRLKNMRLALLTVVTACLLSSCSMIRVLEVASPTQTSVGSGQHFGNVKTVRASLWNGRHGKQDIQCGCANGISRVKITTKPGDIVVGFLTAGFVVKQRLEWDCAQRDDAPGDIIIPKKKK